jgi:hypothetical protein
VHTGYGSELPATTSTLDPLRIETRLTETVKQSSEVLLPNPKLHEASLSLPYLVQKKKS